MNSSEKPHCKLTGKDGNVFAIIGLVVAALKNAGFPEHAVEFREKAFKAESYDEVLRLCMEYVDVH